MEMMEGQNCQIDIEDSDSTVLREINYHNLFIICNEMSIVVKFIVRLESKKGLISDGL